MDDDRDTITGNMSRIVSVYNNNSIPETSQIDEVSVCCGICHEKKGIKSQHIILNCKHIFHIECLSLLQYSDYLNICNVSEFYSNSKCPICEDYIDISEILYIHTKSMITRKKFLMSHLESIKKLEDNLSKIKDELKTCYDYKNSLEKEYKISKEIVITCTEDL